jgi:hypothetical protein
MFVVSALTRRKRKGFAGQAFVARTEKDDELVWDDGNVAKTRRGDSLTVLLALVVWFGQVIIIHSDHISVLFLCWKC